MNRYDGAVDRKELERILKEHFEIPEDLILMDVKMAPAEYHQDLVLVNGLSKEGYELRPFHVTPIKPLQKRSA